MECLDATQLNSLRCGRWAVIDTLLDALPDAVVDELLLEYPKGLYA